MKLYNVFIKEDSNGKIADVRFLKEGISILALLFTPFWFLYHKMYKEFVAVIIISTIFSYFFANLSETQNFILQMMLFFVIALNANYWLGQFLSKKKNYNFAGVAFGKDHAEAKLNFTRNSKIEFSDLNLNLIS